MTLKELEALGFVSCGGQLDYRNKNYGFLSPSGPVLTPEGHELYASLVGAKVAAEAAPTPSSSRRPRQSKQPVVDSFVDEMFEEIIGTDPAPM